MIYVLYGAIGVTVATGIVFAVMAFMAGAMSDAPDE